MDANFDLDWVRIRAGASGQKEKHVVKHIPTGEVKVFPIRVTMTQIKSEFKRPAEEYEFIDTELELEPVSHVLNNAKSMVTKILNQCTFDKVNFFMGPSDKSNWRFGYANEIGYKSSRTKPKPHYHEEITEYLINKYNPTICYGEETDDVVSRLQTENTVLIDYDKDTDMVPGWHCQLPRSSETVDKYYVSEAMGRYNFYFQLLKGDNADTIPGINGVSDIGALSILLGLKGVKKQKGELPRTKQNHLESIESSTEEVLALRAHRAYKKAYKEQALGKMINRGNLLWMPHQGKEVWVPPDCILKLEGKTVEDIKHLLPEKE